MYVPRGRFYDLKLSILKIFKTDVYMYPSNDDHDTSHELQLKMAEAYRCYGCRDMLCCHFLRALDTSAGHNDPL